MLVQLNQATSQAFWISVMSELFRRDYFSVLQATRIIPDTYSAQMSYGTAPVFTASSKHASSSTIACALLHFLGQITQTPLYPLETVDYGFPASLYSTLSTPQNQLWVSLVQESILFQKYLSAALFQPQVSFKTKQIQRFLPSMYSCLYSLADQSVAKKDGPFPPPKKKVPPHISKYLDPMVHVTQRSAEVFGPHVK